MSIGSHDTLRRIPLFREFTDEECTAVGSLVRVREFATGDVVLHQGAPGDTMVIVLDGRLRVEMTDAKGSRNEVGSVGPGEIVGEMAVLDPAPRAASVVAASGAVVYELGRGDLQKLRAIAPAASATIVSAIIGDVTRRLRQVNQRIDKELNPQAAAAAQKAPAEKAAPGRAVEDTASGGSVFSRIWAKLTGD